MTLEALYRMIPDFNCKPDCIQCCENKIQFAPEEREKAPKPEEDREDAFCSYVCENGCTIHEIRPLLCRIYGNSELMKCPHGCGPERLLSEAETRRIIKEYVRIKEEQEK